MNDDQGVYTIVGFYFVGPPPSGVLPRRPAALIAVIFIIPSVLDPTAFKELRSGGTLHRAAYSGLYQQDRLDHRLLAVAHQIEGCLALFKREPMGDQLPQIQCPRGHESDDILPSVSVALRSYDHEVL